MADPSPIPHRMIGTLGQHVQKEQCRPTRFLVTLSLPPGQLAATFWAGFLCPQGLCSFTAEVFSDLDNEKQVPPRLPSPVPAKLRPGLTTLPARSPDAPILLICPLLSQTTSIQEGHRLQYCFVPSWCLWARGHMDNSGKQWTGTRRSANSHACSAPPLPTVPLADYELRADPSTNQVGVGWEREGKQTKKKGNAQSFWGEKAASWDGPASTEGRKTETQERLVGPGLVHPFALPTTPTLHSGADQGPGLSCPQEASADTTGSPSHRGQQHRRAGRVPGRAGGAQRPLYTQSF